MIDSYCSCSNVKKVDVSLHETSVNPHWHSAVIEITFSSRQHLYIELEKAYNPFYVQQAPESTVFAIALFRYICIVKVWE